MAAGKVGAIVHAHVQRQLLVFLLCILFWVVASIGAEPIGCLVYVSWKACSASSSKSPSESSSFIASVAFPARGAS